MKRRIMVATAVVATTMVAVGVIAALVAQSLVAAAAADELVRQAEVASTQIEDDLERFSVGPDAGVRQSIARYRPDFTRSLFRARQAADLDVIAARISAGAREIPIGGDQTVLAAISPDTPSREAVEIDVSGQPMYVVVEVVDLGFGTLTVAVGRYLPVIAGGTVVIPLLIAGAVGAGMAVALGAWFSNTTTRRLQRVSAAAAAVGSGDRSARAQIGGNDEIADLGIAIDDMARQLDAARMREHEFLMSVGHDLRTPLTTIRGYAESLATGRVDSDDLVSVGAVLERQTRALGRLVDDVMMLARLDSGEFTLREETVNLSRVVAEVVAGFERRAQFGDVTIETRLADTVVRVADQDRITQIIGNLMENALRYTPSQGTIEVSCSTEGGRCTISVGNSGPGLEPIDLKRIFDRRYVAERDRAVRPAGSGLGLAIVAELAQGMGGSATCHSIPGRWTVVSVTL